MKTIYLVNNKQKEPDFAVSFEKALQDTDVAYREVRSDEFAFFCPRRSAAAEVWLRGEKQALSKDDFFFLRKSHPHGAAVTLLAVTLRAQHIPMTDELPNLHNSIRTSKLSQPFELKPYGVLFPDTWVVTPESFRENEAAVLGSLSFPLVMKMKGGMGQKVWKCDTKEALEAALAAHVGNRAHVLFLLQEFIPNSYDLRILVYKNEVLASIQRASADGFHNNVSQGGTARAIESTLEEQALALLAAEKIGLDLAGVDIVRTPEGPLVFEINKAPDVTSFNEAAGQDLAALIARRMLAA